MSWIKVETTTPDKLEIWDIAKHCNCSRDSAFAAFFRFFAWSDGVTADGHIQRLTPEYADEKAGLKGFGNAMSEVGWMVFTPNGATVANWDRHNGQSAKRRANDASSKAARRAASPHAVRNVSASKADSLRTREEERREDENPESNHHSYMDDALPDEGQIVPSKPLDPPRKPDHNMPHI